MCGYGTLLHLFCSSPRPDADRAKPTKVAGYLVPVKKQSAKKTSSAKLSTSRGAQLSAPKPPLRAAFSLVTQGANRFYTCTLFGKVLARTCFVTRRSDDPDGGFQRALERKRATAIADYIDEGGSIPNAIVLSAQPEANLRTSGGKTLVFNDTPNAFLILDGQHRVYGFMLAKDELRVPVVIYNNLTRAEEAKLFIDINTTQRPVPNALLLDIRRLAETESNEESFLNDLFNLFYESPDSPLIGSLSRSEQIPGKISRVTFNNAVQPALRMFADFSTKKAYDILRPYLKVWHDGLKVQKVDEALSKSVVFRAILGLFPMIAQRVQDRHGKKYTEEAFADVLTTAYFKAIRSKLRGNYGNSIKAFQDKLSKAFSRTLSL